MATSHYFNGRQVKLPGVYSAVKSLMDTPIIASPYSKALIVNVDPNNSFGGSVNGELTKGADSLYRLRGLGQAQGLLRAGKLYHVTTPLFRPSRSPGVSGISELYYINALTSTAPVLTVPLTLPVALTFKVKDEGVSSNGVAVSGTAGLASGYGLTIESGVRSTSKFIFKFWRGTFKGNYSDGIAYDGVTKESAKPELVAQSSEVTTFAELVAWANTDKVFAQGFTIGTATDAAGASYQFVAGDKTDPGEFILAAGATSTYASTDLEAALELVKSLDFSTLVVLSKVGDGGAADTLATRLQYFIQSEVKGEKFLALPGVSNGASTDVTDNITQAAIFNSDRVWLTHGIIRKNSILAAEGYREFDSIYLNALIVGRILGLAPQIPGSFKSLDIDGISLPLSDQQKEDCLDGGVLTVVYDEELENFIILRDINTLQNNVSLQNPDGTSFSIQLTRISAQLNRDIVVNVKKTIFANQSGTNRLTLSEQYLSDWTSTFLNRKIATPTQDNLILGWSDVNVTREQDAYYITYKFIPNNSIEFVFFTGFSIS